MEEPNVDNRSLRSFLRPTQIPPEIAGLLRARQLASVDRLIWIIVLGNLISLWAVLESFWATGIQNLLTIWAITLAGVCLFAVTRYFENNRFKGQSTRPQKSIDSTSRYCLVLGIVWGLAPLIVIPSADPMAQMALGIILVGLMFTGAILLGRIPQAAFSLVVPIAFSFILSLQFNFEPLNSYLSVLTVLYLAFLAISIRWSHRQFVGQVVNGEALKSQSHLIGLLLRDFEESSSDWLWQTDEEGVLTEIPMTIGAEKSEYSVMRRGQRMSELFEESDALNIFMRSVERHQGFRDLVLQVKEAGAETWWSITGKPVYEGGFFTGFRGVASDVTQSKETEDRIAYMAHYDGLTGLPNRATFRDALEKIVRRPDQKNRQRAILWLDLDKFKWVNDTLGHPAGDELLRVVASRIMRVADQEDVVARLGGDEFALIIERPKAQDEIESFLRRLTRELGRSYDISGSTVNCSASVGVRLFENDGTNTSVLIKHADLALYHAKEQGRGSWSMFHQSMEDQAQERSEVENDLRLALKRDELLLHFQPLVDAETHELSGCETLIRWQHPVKGLIMPGQFIEYAEDCGLITKVGDWVIRAALAEASRLPPDVRVAINISPLQIHSASLMTTIFEAVSKNKIDPTRIELEITESVLMSNTEFTLKRLHRLKKMGFRIALDDFGTGFSSLSYLQSFPFDKIKIDKSFVSDLETNIDNQKITIATLGLAKSLGLSCTAEGVETQQQADFLKQHGCDDLQGYFFGKPNVLEELQRFVPVKERQSPAVASTRDSVLLPRRA